MRKNRVPHWSIFQPEIDHLKKRLKTHRLRLDKVMDLADQLDPDDLGTGNPSEKVQKLIRLELKLFCVERKLDRRLKLMQDAQSNAVQAEGIITIPAKNFDY